MASKCAVVFPGQGSQYPGMAKDIYQGFESIKEMFEIAEEITGIQLRKIMFEGYKEELKKTYITQPAIFLHSSAVWEICKQKLPHPSFVAGHSLGEFSALYASEVWSFEDALKIVAKRGRLMYEAGKNQKGSMAAIIGLSLEEVREICDGTENLYLVNLNSPQQFVISGTEEAVEEGIKKATKKNAKKAIKLAVSGAFHTPFLQEAARMFSQFLDGFKFNSPVYPVIMNVTGEPTKDVSMIKENIKKQLTNPVQWIKTLEILKKEEIETVYELGPGRVLCGILKRTYGDIKCINIDKVEDVRVLLSSSV